MAVADTDFETRFARFAEACGPAVFEDLLPTGSRVAFFEGAPGFPGLVELVELTPGQEAAYAGLRELCRDWDGSEPWRTS